MQATSRYFSAFFRPRRGVRGPTLIGVSSQHTAYAKVIKVRIRLSACSRATAAAWIVPCTNPTEGAAPVNDSTNPTHRCTGMAWITIRYTHHARRFGP